jgi:hypothetical protein
MATSTSTTTQKTYLVEKLTTTNYSIWNVKMEIILTLNQTFFVVDGSEPNLGNIYMKNKRWKKRVDIILHFGDPQMQLVESLKTSKKVWEKLTSTYK